MPPSPSVVKKLESICLSLSSAILTSLRTKLGVDLLPVWGVVMMLSGYLLWPRKQAGLFGALDSLRNGLPILSTVLLAVLFSGCAGKKPVAVALPPSPPPPPAPTASIEASPIAVQAGQPVIVSWKTENAADVSIDQFGPVQPNGSQSVTLTESTTYRITAKGPGGVQEKDVRVTVTNDATETPSASEEPIEGAPESRMDVYFDYDDSSIRSDQLVTIRSDADFLKRHPTVHILVEGNCDELGSTEYNLTLGEMRASEVRSALVKAGISAGRIEIRTYGKERPICGEESEACWQKNRRAHIAITGVD
jgi:peptidoglycan-associated lipoprotein